MLHQLMEVLGRWSIQTLDALPTYTAGKVILLGDAVSPTPLLSRPPSLTCFQAHAMSQHLGAGAGQGIEVGFALSSRSWSQKVSPISQLPLGRK